MEDFLKEALGIVKAQASVRTMGEDEILSMTRKIAAGLAGLAGGSLEEAGDGGPAITPAEAKKSIREKSVICLECGKSFKVLTKRHLASHDLTPATYKEKYGLPKGGALTCKALARDRKKKMSEMRLWERRKGAGKAPATPPAAPKKSKKKEKAPAEGGQPNE